MATLTDADFRQIRDLIKSNAPAHAVFRVWSLDKPTWKALFQGAETWFVNAFNTTPATSFKAALDAISTTTAEQARWVGKVWFMWRIGIDW